MSTTLLKVQCKALKLGSIPSAYARIPFESKEQFLTAVFAAEIETRKENRIRRALKRAGFANTKPLDTFEWDAVALPSKTTPEILTGLDFIGRKECLILMGDPGLGKTHLATALGIQACMEGHSVRFFRTAELVSQLLEKHTAGSLARFMRDLAKCDLLILDELGYVPLHRHGAELLFNVVADCYERRSVIVTTNLEFGQWNTVLADNRLTAAMIDRLVHHAHILGFSGESYRLRHALTELAQSADPQQGGDTKP